jgi:hypothetical protein
MDPFYDKIVCEHAKELEAEFPLRFHDVLEAKRDACVVQGYWG